MNSKFQAPVIQNGMRSVSVDECYFMMGGLLIMFLTHVMTGSAHLYYQIPMAKAVIQQFQTFSRTYGMLNLGSNTLGGERNLVILLRAE